jgi:hypothetical protein
MLGQNEEVDALASERAMLGWRGAGRKRKPKEHASLGHDSVDNRHLIRDLNQLSPATLPWQEIVVLYHHLHVRRRHCIRYGTNHFNLSRISSNATTEPSLGTLRGGTDPAHLQLDMSDPAANLRNFPVSPHPRHFSCLTSGHSQPGPASRARSTNPAREGF